MSNDTHQPCWQTVIDDLKAALAAVKKDHERLKAAQAEEIARLKCLAGYARHDDDCNQTPNHPTRCRCGWDEARTEAGL